MGLSLRTIQRIWAADKLQPHRIRTFKRSNGPDFAAKLDDVVGLYMNPPRHAAVVSIDEKSQIQALDRTQPGLPLKRGKCATLTHDYKRHGTTTLFAALSVLEGKVIGRCVPRHRHQEFIRFIATVERSVPAGKVIHAVLDNYAAHKHPQVPPPVHRLSLFRRVARADFARALIAAADAPAVSARTFDVFNEPGAPPTDTELAERLEQLSKSF